jgi:hypothetical protein
MLTNDVQTFFLNSITGSQTDKPIEVRVVLDCVLNVMAHAQKPDLVFRGNGRLHLNRRGCQFSRLLAAEVCESAVVMLDTPCSEVAWEYWLPTQFASFTFTSPPVRLRVSSGFNWTLLLLIQILSIRASTVLYGRQKKERNAHESGNCYDFIYRYINLLQYELFKDYL